MSTDKEYARECATRVAEALGELWGATDYPESHDVSAYSEEQLKAFLGERIHVRKACDSIFSSIRAARPDLPGWDPISKDKPIDERLADSGSSPA